MLGEVSSAEDVTIQRSLDEVIKKFDDYCLPQKKNKRIRIWDRTSKAIALLWV